MNRVPIAVEVLSMERTNLCRELLYTDNNFHPNLGFMFSTQTMFVTFNLDSRKGSLHHGAVQGSGQGLFPSRLCDILTRLHFIGAREIPDNLDVKNIKTVSLPVLK